MYTWIPIIITECPVKLLFILKPLGTILGLNDSTKRVHYFKMTMS